MSELGLLPDGWGASSLKEVGKVISGNAFKSTQFVPAGVPVVKISNIQYGEYIEKNQEYLPLSYINEFSNFQIESGDLLLALTRPITNGQLKVCKYPKGAGTALLNQRVAKLETSKSLTQQFFEYYLRSKSFLGQVENGLSETLQPNLSPKTLIDFIVPLPPLAEQKVIADKLDELLAQVESTKARLDAIPAILKSFRQSVLAAAVSGKLTEVLISKSKKLSDVASFQSGFAFKSGWFTKSDKWQVIKLGNIRDGHLFIENAPAYVSDDIANDFLKFSPNKGDTLISMTGTRFKKDYGFGCLVDDERDILINQRVGRLIPTHTEVAPEFLNIFIRSDLFRDQFFEGETGGVNQGNVGSKHIMSVRIEVPKLSQQAEIVRRVEELFALADKVEAQVNAAQKRVNNLTQSILAKAFRGELTADWRAANPELISGENSATALLERIKAEREKLKPAKKTRAKKAKA